MTATARQVQTLDNRQVLHVDRYLEYYGLNQDPFALTADPFFMYLGDGHAEALAALELGVFDRRGLIVVVGEVGTGKTTLAKYVLESAGRSFAGAFVSTTTLSFEDILISAMKSLGVFSIPQGKRALLEALEQFLAKKDEEGTTVALIVDEAQNLSDEVLEEFRLLLNIETAKSKLLQIVLMGQPELHQKLQKPTLRHVAARVAVRANLNPLSNDETHDYIEHRLRVAGGELEIFSPGALKVLDAHSRGLPREINVNCHNALMFGFGAGDRQIEPSVMKQAIKSRQGEGLKTFQTKPRRWPRWTASGVVALSLLAVGGYLGSLMTGDDLEAGMRDGREGGAKVEAKVAVEPPSVEDPVTRTPDESQALTILREPDGTHVVRVEQGITLSELMLGVYGSFEPALLDLVVEANPQIRNPDLLRVGQVVRLPPKTD